MYCFDSLPEEEKVKKKRWKCDIEAWDSCLIYSTVPPSVNASMGSSLKWIS